MSMSNFLRSELRGTLRLNHRKCADMTDAEIDAEIDRALEPQDRAYAPLRDVLDEAYNQASSGKGAQRHANGRPFISQPSMEHTRIVGLGYPLGQAMKKSGEAAGMANRGEHEAAVRECLGAIVFLAMAVLRLREEKSSLD